MICRWIIENVAYRIASGNIESVYFVFGHAEQLAPMGACPYGHALEQFIVGVGSSIRVGEIA